MDLQLTCYEDNHPPTLVLHHGQKSVKLSATILQHLFALVLLATEKKIQKIFTVFFILCHYPYAALGH